MPNSSVILVFIASLLGWKPAEEDRELYTPEDLVKEFTLERIGASARRFDFKKVQWLNGQHIRRLTPDDLCERAVPILEKAGFDVASCSREWLTQVVALCQEKIGTLNDIIQFVDFFFVEPTEYEEKAVDKQWRKDGALEKMLAIRQTLELVEPWTHDALKAAYETLAEEEGVGLGQFIHPTRLALTGKSVGPGLFELAEVMGKETALARMDKAVAYVRSLGDE